MEAPEKIYLYPDDRAGYEYEAEWGDKPWGEDSIEYTRTDVVIDKAVSFIRNCTSYDGLGYKAKCVNLEKFKKYMDEQ